MSMQSYKIYSKIYNILLYYFVKATFAMRKCIVLQSGDYNYLVTKLQSYTVTFPIQSKQKILYIIYNKYIIYKIQPLPPTSCNHVTL